MARPIWGRPWHVASSRHSDSIGNPRTLELCVDGRQGLVEVADDLRAGVVTHEYAVMHPAANNYVAGVPAVVRLPVLVLLVLVPLGPFFGPIAPIHATPSPHRYAEWAG